MTDLLSFFLVVTAILAVLGTAAWAGLRAAPWVPTRRKDVARLLRLASVRPGDVVYDLGCGDGRVLFEAARLFGARAVGCEISLLPYLVASIRWVFSPYRRRVTILYRDFFRVPLNNADVVFCFLTPSAMQRLRTKFVHELKRDARVVSYSFSIAGWQPVAKDKPTNNSIPAFLYRQGEP